MAVTYDTFKSIDFSNVNNVTTAAFTIAADDNRVAVLNLHWYSAAISGISVACGGQAGSAVTNAAKTQSTANIVQFGVIAPAAGSQTASAAWTTNANGTLGAITAYGAAQSSQFTGGQNNGASGAGAVSITIPSDNGDLTISGSTTSTANQSSNQTEVYEGSASVTGSGDYGPGTGETTHSWTPGAAAHVAVAGCNVEAVAAGGGSATKNTRAFPLGMNLGMPFRM